MANRSVALPIIPIYLPRRGNSRWVLLQAPRKGTLCSLKPTSSAVDHLPGGVWFDHDVWLGWTDPSRSHGLPICETTDVEVELVKKDDQSISMVEKSLADLQAETHDHLLDLARQKLFECAEAQRPRKRTALVASLRRSLGISSGRTRAFVLDPLEIMQVLSAQEALPPISAKADRDSFGSGDRSNLPIGGVDWLLEYIAGNNGADCRRPELNSMTPAEAVADRRRLRITQHVADLWIEPPIVLPLASDPEAEACLVRKALALPQDFSDLALARWLVSQSFVRLSIDAASLVQRLFDMGVVQESECGRLSYRLAKFTEQPCSVFPASAHAQAEDGFCQAGQHYAPKLLKRVRRRWTIEVTPTYSHKFIQQCRETDNLSALAAVLRGHKPQASQVSAGSVSNKKKHASRCDDDSVSEKCRVLWEDSRARRQRQSSRREGRHDKANA